MKRLAWILIPALCLAVTVGAGSSTPLVRSFAFNDSGHGFMTGTFEDDFSGSCAGGSYTSTSGHTLTCNNTASVADDAMGQTGGVQDGKARWFDGSNDHLSIAQGVLDTTPAADFSMVVAFTPHTVAGTIQILMGVLGNSANRSWYIYQSQDDLWARVSDDGTLGGGHYSTVVQSAKLSIGVMHIAVVSYDYISDGGSNLILYLDEETPNADASASGPCYDSSEDLYIGSDTATSFPFLGDMLGVKYIDGKALSATEAAQEIRMMRGLLTADGLNHVTVTSASPPMALVAAADSGVEPFLVPQPANSATIGPAGLYGASGTVNLVHRGVLEAWAAGAPTGWTKAETAGDGTAAVSQETGTMAEGLSSAKMTLTGATSSAQITSTCVSCVDICGADPCNCDISASAFIKGTGGAEDLDLRFAEYDTDACVTWVQTDTLVNGKDGGTSWEKISGTIAAAAIHANTSSLTVYLKETGNGGVTSYVDAITLSVSDPSVRDSYCGSDAAAATTCDDVFPDIMTPWFGNFHGCIAMDVALTVDWDQIDSYEYIAGMPGTAGADNKVLILAIDPDTLACRFYDEGGTVHTGSVAANGAAGATYAIKCCKTHDGRMWADFDGTKGTEASGGIQDDIGTTLNIAGYPGTAGDAHVSNLRFERVVP